MNAQKIEEQNTMKSPNCVAIIAILAEMARCLNKNIAKVHVAPLDSTLTGDGTVDLAKLIAEDSKATMVNTLAWLMRHNGDSGGGIFATHPATSERIQALQTLR